MGGARAPLHETPALQRAKPMRGRGQIVFFIGRKTLLPMAAWVPRGRQLRSGLRTLALHPSYGCSAGHGAGPTLETLEKQGEL